MRVKRNTFSRGGIHPPERKKNDFPIEGIGNVALPRSIVLPLSQHIGSPSELLVNKGDTIRENQLIGKSSGFVSSNIHSPLPGVVEEITEIYLPNGIKTQAINIEVGQEFKKYGKSSRREWEKLSNDELISIVSDRGIVGLGGATFPTHVKLSVPKGKKCKTFIVNAAECEPYLQSDYFLLKEHSAEIAEGLEIVLKILQPEKCFIGIEQNKSDIAPILKEQLYKKELYDAEIVILKNKYPQGAEKNLIEAITGKEIPSGKLPLEIGAINLNVGTLYAIYEAVVFNRPLTNRVVTVSGGAIANPSVIKAFIGTTYRQIIEECGGFIEDPVRIISGGPMMGFTLFDLDTPITKGTSGILALTKKEIRDAEMRNCISCGRCVHVCPMGLMPTTLYKYIQNNQLEDASDLALLDCVECGSCSFSCPSRIPLVQGFRKGKKALRSKGANR